MSMHPVLPPWPKPRPSRASVARSTSELGIGATHVLVAIGLLAVVGLVGWRYYRNTHRSHAALALFPPQTLLQKHRTILVQGDLNDVMAAHVVQQLGQLYAVDSRKPVTLLLDTTGGAVGPAEIVRAAMNRMTMPIHTHCLQGGDGAALFLLAHGARGHRTASSSAQFSLTPLTFSAPRPALVARPAMVGARRGSDLSRASPVPGVVFAGGNDGLLAYTKGGGIAEAHVPSGAGSTDSPAGVDSDVPSPARADDDQPDPVAEENARMRTAVYESLAGDTGQSVTQIEEDFAASRRFAASEAVTYGLIDRIEE